MGGRKIVEETSLQKIGRSLQSAMKTQLETIEMEKASLYHYICSL